MESETIGVNVLDMDLERFLDLYKIDGRDTHFGHVLVKQLSSSRPRPANGPPGEYLHQNNPVTRYKAVEDSRVKGVYNLASRSEPFETGWIQWLADIRAAGAQDMNLTNFISVLGDRNMFGDQCPKIIMYSHGTSGLRPDLGIRQNPVSAANAAQQVKSSSRSFQFPWTQVNTAGSPIRVQTAFANFTTVVYHHRGKPFHWIIVPPSQKAKLEDILRRQYQREIAAEECSQFVHHLSLWITPERLRLWNIVFHEITQSAGNLLFIFPGTYFHGFSMGHNVLEFKYHAGQSWNCENYHFCKLELPLCEKCHRGRIPLYVQRQEDLAENTDGDGKNLLAPIKRRKRPRKASTGNSPMMGWASPARPSPSPGFLSPAEPNLLTDFNEPAGENRPTDQNIPADIESQLPQLWAEEQQIYSPHLASDSPDGQVAYLLQVNHDLGQENRTLHGANRDLGSKLQETSSEREVDLRDRLHEACTHRDQFLSFLFERDEEIKSLKMLLADTYSVQERLQVTAAERDSLKSTQVEIENYIGCLERQASGIVGETPWRETAMKAYRLLSAKDKRIAELESLLVDNKIPVPRK